MFSPVPVFGGFLFRAASASRSRHALHASQLGWFCPPHLSQELHVACATVGKSATPDKQRAAAKTIRFNICTSLPVNVMKEHPMPPRSLATPTWEGSLWSFIPESAAGPSSRVAVLNQHPLCSLPIRQHVQLLLAVRSTDPFLDSLKSARNGPRRLDHLSEVPIASLMEPGFDGIATVMERPRSPGSWSHLQGGLKWIATIMEPPDRQGHGAIFQTPGGVTERDDRESR